jgi:hypothetical protein
MNSSINETLNVNLCVCLWRVYNLCVSLGVCSIMWTCTHMWSSHALLWPWRGRVSGPSESREQHTQPRHRDTFEKNWIVRWHSVRSKDDIFHWSCKGKVDEAVPALNTALCRDPWLRKLHLLRPLATLILVSSLRSILDWRRCGPQSRSGLNFCFR